ncbi:MAG TPA: EscU/YscU/HrcU family type III secretion system export apparatus switch protein [Acetobacteraceae bacterium]|nr:EscU/YscU/HrcU family type III secretion system export apparatus switch protein [Acetobacteraceae bacterium]
MAGEEGEAGGEDRTEAPTPRRIEKAREQGQVALSREAMSFAALALGTLGLFLALPPLGGWMLLSLRAVLEASHQADPARAAWQAVAAGLPAVAVVAGLAGAGAVAAGLLQTRGMVSAAPMAPRLSKLSPIAGLRRLFGVEGLIEFGRSLLKLGIVGAALWWAAAQPDIFLRALQLSPSGLLAEAASLSLASMVAALGAFALVAVLDLVLVQLRHRHMLRMSRDELRQELKETEGDPQFRARRRQIRESRARRRMLAEVPKASVVITNPTHYAVALAYARDSGAAPKVVARGVDSLAARIREVAMQHRVPVVANPPLARALYPIEPGTEIPPQHYQAVAEIIAYVWRLGRRGASPA